MKETLLSIMIATLLMFSATIGDDILSEKQPFHSLLSSMSKMLESEFVQETENQTNMLPQTINQEIEIIVNGTTFQARLYDNEASQALIKHFPITIDMRELNGNEKYYYFSENFPINSSVPSEIHSGDLMLYGSDCLVLFYESFSSSYSYTPLGYIENPEKLTKAVGEGNVQVTFQIAK